MFHPPSPKVQEYLSSWQYYNPLLNSSLSIAGFITLQAILYPIERLKVLQQVDIIHEVVNEEGRYMMKESLGLYSDSLAKSSDSFAIYRGFSAKLIKYAAREFSLLMLTKRVQDKFQIYKASEHPFKFTALNIFSAAATVSLIEAIIYPIEVAKTRMMCDTAATSSSKTFPSIKQSLFKKGVPLMSMYNGFQLSLMGTAIYRGFQIGAYESALYLGLREKSELLQLSTSILLTIFAQKIVYPLDTLRKMAMLKDTPFKVFNLETHVLMRRMSHPSRKHNLTRGWQLQGLKATISGAFLFTYKALEKLDDYTKE